jgi:Leucine-rich repeat (LRR) protein
MHVLSKNQLEELPEWHYDKVISCSLITPHNNKYTIFPKKILQFKNLKYLNLENNIIKSLPENINLLTNLKELFLGNNHLTDLPDCIALMENLILINAGQNYLQRLPKNIKNIKFFYAYEESFNNLNNFPNNGSMIYLPLYYFSGQLNNLPISMKEIILYYPKMPINIKLPYDCKLIIIN